MGLQMTLIKSKNHMAYDFADAYWAITELNYDITRVKFRLTCYPSREAKQLDGVEILEPSVNGFGQCKPVYQPQLYAWDQELPIIEVFPEGIPLGRDAQLAQLYKFIKEYTGLPFEDVFEDAEIDVEPTNGEPAVEPEPVVQTPEEPEDPEPETIVEPEVAEDPVAEPEPEGAPETEPETVEETTKPEDELVTVPDPEPTPEPEPEVYHNPLSL